MAWSGAYVAASAGAAAVATVASSSSSNGNGTGASGSSRGQTIKRLKRGAKRVVAEMGNANDEPLPSIHELDSAFQMGEYLELLVKRDPHDIERIVSLPGEILEEAARDGRSTRKEEALWVYEHLRRIPLDLVPLITALLAPSSGSGSGKEPTCSRASCPEMRAEGWQYICVAHAGKEGEDCCAIDYILHTIDSMTASLVSTQSFPSRLTIKPGSEKLFPLLARRVSRVFSHTYFHHREVFEAAEAETALYARFVALSERYALVAPELLVIPRDAIAGLSGAKSGKAAEQDTSSTSGTASAPADDTGEPDIPSTSRKTMRDTTGSQSDRAGTLGRARGRGRGRGGKSGRTLFPVEIQKEEDEDGEVDEEDAAPATGDDASQGKSDGAASEEADGGTSDDEPAIPRKERTESMVYHGNDGDDSDGQTGKAAQSDGDEAAGQSA